MHKNYLCLLKSSSIPFKKKKKKCMKKNFRLLPIQTKMIAAAAFQNFTPVQKDKYKITHNYQFPFCFFVFYFSIFIFYNPSVTIFFILKTPLGLGHVSCAEPIPPQKALRVTVYSTFHGFLSASNVSYLPRNSPHKYGCSHFLPSIPQSTGHETTQPPGSASRTY